MTNSVAATLRHWRRPEVLALREETAWIEAIRAR